MAATGIVELLGLEEEQIYELAQKNSSHRGWEQAIQDEFNRLDPKYEEDKKNARYVLSEVATEVEVVGNDGKPTIRDLDHGGRTLDWFLELKEAQTARLSRAEVGALRIYTTSTYALINNSLRARSDLPRSEWRKHPVPLAATTYCIYTALKKLRAVNFCDNDFSFETEVVLWRGMRNLDLRDDELLEFMKHGGCEYGCVSTSQKQSVVISYAKSLKPLIFKLKVQNRMDLGADISWLSVFPNEKEFLYPPLTYLHPCRNQAITAYREKIGRLLTVKVSFPS
eukprot:8562822-Pyramimonas_sp.AAC.2